MRFSLRLLQRINTIELDEIVATPLFGQDQFELRRIIIDGDKPWGGGVARFLALYFEDRVFAGANGKLLFAFHCQRNVQLPPLPRRFPW